MAQWSEIANTESYKKLPESEKLLTKQKFFNDVVVKSPKYAELDPKLQTKLRREFAVLAPIEVVPQGNWLEQAGQAVTKFAQGQIAADPIMRSVATGNAVGDAVVNKAASAVETPIPVGDNVNAARVLNSAPVRFTQLMAGEVMRAYKPSEVGPFVGAMKAVGPVAKTVGKAVWDKTPQGIKTALTTNLAVGRGAPKEYLEAADQAALARQQGAAEAEDIGKKLFYADKPMSYTDETGKVIKLKKGDVLPQEMQQNVGKIFTGDFDAVEKLKSHPQYDEMNKLATEGRAIQDKWSKELADSGIPSEEVEEIIKDNIGTYMARMYRSKLQKNDALSFLSLKNLRLRLDGLKHRKDLTEEVRAKLGEIKEPALPVATRVKQISESVSNEKLFKKVADNPEWSADTNLTGKMIRMADTKTMGSLRNKWVIPEIAADINAITKVSGGTDLQSQLYAGYEKGMSMWKFGKVVLNPSTHARNTMANSILLDLSGVNHIEQGKLLPRVVADYLQKGKVYQQAVKHGAIGNEFVGGDVKAIRDWYVAGSGNNMQKWMNVMRVPFDKAGNLYQAEEQIGKLIKFQHGLDKGLSPEIAAKEAQKWLFDYKKIPEAIKVAKLAAPFITFTYKATPRVVEALVNNPLRVYKYKALFDGVNEASRKLNGITPEEYARKEKALPPWALHSIGGMPANLLMPYKDKYGRDQWLNLEYVLPIGQSTEIAEKGLLKGGVNNPVLNLFADLTKNEDFKGTPIVPPASTQAEAAKYTLNHIYRTLAPSLAPAIGDIEGGYSWEKISKAIEKRPDYAGRLRELGPVLLDTLVGIKVMPIDVDEAEGMKMKDKQKMLIDLRKQAMKVMSPAYNPKKRDAELENVFKKMQQIMEN